ncbi:hypothetical protein AZL_b00490 (plasmid) [Azospirillum sp. B510]|uniref:ABC transporter substrate binding protein n=1 Tax=Azospirillum sp. (strain B510) TaxID=137722 RepID=UPI0001C4C9BE|nr:ABC transporter substrate binding protein [Azospirillum sp. B510]BAI74712.1 hypothetical protein AZL_b00490 [Azospirillum sp. B510]
MSGPGPIVNRRQLIAGTAAAVLAGGLPAAARAARATDNALLPKLTDARHWRIGYAETMPYGNYAGTLASIVKGLDALSWLSGAARMPYDAGQSDSEGLWRWLSSRDLGPRIRFVADGWYGGLDQAPAEPILRRLESGGDLDLMIVMGTIAGRKLAVDRHAVPTLVFSTTNAVAAGIVTAADLSGRDHVWAHVDPQRYHRQIRIFHETFGFRRLGIAYENSTAGRAIASIADIEAVAGQLGYELVARHVRAPAGPDDQERYYADLAAAWGDLAQRVDAMYITFGRWTLERFPALVRVFQERGIPTFSQLGPEEVAQGALMSVARSDFDGIGQFGASVIARLANGERLRDLRQIYFDTPTIAWNLAVADRMGYRPAMSALLAADNIYTSLGATP